MLGTVLSRLLTLTPIISTTAPEVGAFYYQPHFKDAELEAGKVQ